VLAVEKKVATSAIAELTLPAEYPARDGEAEECLRSRDREHLFDGGAGIRHVIHEAHHDGEVVLRLGRQRLEVDLLESAPHLHAGTLRALARDVEHLGSK